MPVPTSITDLSTTAASNSPAGTEAPSTLDNYQRAHAAFIAQIRAVIGGATDANIPSAWATDADVDAAIAAALASDIAAASETVAGIVELATVSEAVAGTDTQRAVTPAGLLARTPSASETVPGLIELATAAEALAGTDTARAVTPAGIEAARPISAQCSAWVNFNGTGTVAIRDSYNVSSITDNGTGDYDVNFATAMANTNFAPVGSLGESGATSASSAKGLYIRFQSTSKVRVVGTTGTGAAADYSTVTVAIFGGN